MLSLSGLPVGNIPLGEDLPYHPLVERTASLPVPQQLNTGFGPGATRHFTSQMRPDAFPDTGRKSQNYFPFQFTGNLIHQLLLELRSPENMQLNALVGENLEELGITKHSGPRYSTYATLDARLKSYGHWPPQLKQTPRTMAQAGFFHLGSNT